MKSLMTIVKRIRDKIERAGVEVKVGAMTLEMEKLNQLTRQPSIKRVRKRHRILKKMSKTTHSVLATV
jgi:hypothetical protein